MFLRLKYPSYWLKLPPAVVPMRGESHDVRVENTAQDRLVVLKYELRFLSFLRRIFTSFYFFYYRFKF